MGVDNRVYSRKELRFVDLSIAKDDILLIIKAFPLEGKGDRISGG